MYTPVLDDFIQCRVEPESFPCAPYTSVIIKTFSQCLLQKELEKAAKPVSIHTIVT